MFSQQFPESGIFEAIRDDNPTEETASLSSWQDGHVWLTLSLNRRVVAITATWNERLLAIDDSGRIHRLNLDGTWDVVLDAENQGNQGQHNEISR